MYYKEILDIISTGIVIIDRHYKVLEWNRWMSFFSKIEREKIVNTNLFHHYPDLNQPSFLRVCKSVFTFGNIIYLSQKIHNYLFPFKVIGSHASHFEYMQQNCNIAPLKNKDGEIELIVISVQDVTESVIVEKRLKNLNATDGVTGIYNRRYLDSRMKEEFFRLKRYGMILSIIMFDIDYFKNLNDNLGHPFGDFVLQRMSLIIKELIRDVDVLARYGGDEFICLLPETDIEGAETLAERIRIKVCEGDFTYSGKTSSISVSLGAAQVEEGVEGPEDLLKAADEALYEAKNAGRNCVRVFRNKATKTSGT